MYLYISIIIGTCVAYSETYTYLLVLKVGKILAVEVKDKPPSPPALADSYNETTVQVICVTQELWRPHPQYNTW